MSTYKMTCPILKPFLDRLIYRKNGLSLIKGPELDALVDCTSVQKIQVKIGQQIKKGQIIVFLDSWQGISIEIYSPFNGIVKNILVKNKDYVKQDYPPILLIKRYSKFFP